MVTDNTFIFWAWGVNTLVACFGFFVLGELEDIDVDRRLSLSPFTTLPLWLTGSIASRKSFITFSRNFLFFCSAVQKAFTTSEWANLHVPIETKPLTGWICLEMNEKFIMDGIRKKELITTLIDLPVLLQSLLSAETPKTFIH